MLLPEIWGATMPPSPVSLPGWPVCVRYRAAAAALHGPTLLTQLNAGETVARKRLHDWLFRANKTGFAVRLEVKPLTTRFTLLKFAGQCISISSTPSV